MQNNQEIIDATVAYVKTTLEGAEGGHDWWHIYRVWQLSRQIAVHEKVDQLIVELGALLHDIADSKFHNGDENIGPEKARAFMTSLGLPEVVKIHVENIIRNISFKGGHNNGGFRSPELNVVQDADRMDAIGAIGIARAFNYGGFKNRAIYDPTIKPVLEMTREQYKNNTAPTINHFYEKLLLLRDRMNTATGKAMAEERHRFMEVFLEQFYKEAEL
ncbi:HD domain-containing protein [Chitinophaga qingshengii]|uniref:HD domain-containing protein n=1 Tax=Chitinophaga qingshengii TaxID=1569794 RepID=A0ABR7TJ06_9BACT|nr:HD domain-containing protein [Chitinophaga qingshengii]MBC9930481.1 HD domain-containing protein [Chitinophaga qingshengii]